MAEPIVQLQNGLIRGNVEKHEEGFEYYSFKGIPYAEPPVGTLRFKDPIPKKQWSGVIDCKNDGPMCLQYNFLLKIKSCEEDCLYLNVFTRSINANNKGSPVLMIVHFGASVVGHASSSLYGPDYLIRKDVVLVMPNYRLGVMGFLDLEDEVAPGNQGFKDLVMVLEWVQKNIRLFGGDPDNVTVFGAIAGAVGANYLALSPLTKGLIHKVISSGCVVYNSWVGSINPKWHAIELCSLLGKNLTDSREIFEFLRSVDAEKLVDAQERLRRSLDYFPFTPGVDSKSRNPFMPVHRYVAADQGVHLPYLVGCNSHESFILLSDELCFSEISKENFFELGNLNFGKMLAFNSKEILNRYNLTEMQVRRLYYKNEMVSHENLDNYLEFAQDIYFSEGIHRLARVQAEQSSAATYLYQLSYVPPDPLCAILMPDLADLSKRGCGHFEEMPFLFKMAGAESKGLPCLKKGTQSYKIMEQMTEMWTNFARYGKPTVETSELIPVHWQPVNDGTVLRYLNIDEDVTMKTTINVDQKLLSAKNIKI